MCGICGCTEEDGHSGVHEHHHEHSGSAEHLVQIEQNILAKNDQYAEENKRSFLQKNILALNMMSSPGSGKTTLLAKTIDDLRSIIDVAVVVGDQQTDLDARKIQDSGGTAIQINTGKVCHLDAHRVGHAVEKLPLQKQSILIVENIGNLVCPALFNLGEHYKIVILSVTEGDNKPLKYPDMFHAADLLVITKTDLLPYVDFDLAQCKQYALRINPKLDILSLSSKSGEGLQEWYEWLNTKLLGLVSLKKM
ncbi:hydrogenase nickel incorporation protein HypB [Legionella worsleiensis]|uniref:Hydrogenase maturation factor HypB n=1 Tax=Legionella worsleiensis TaxID=45076 RepID=A0A0W1AB03_9GAMM|nr:hydrogenase nickel incorporation protein HypB [Legionella worsleiensis]KTD78275.1 hydrogenase nickel incorporation protein HypB [Legionella worsleiensis]STY32612.1 hydrogenase expression/formation protein HypB [Legionella worsleiensis]